MINNKTMEMEEQLLIFIKELDLINPQKLSLDTLVEKDLGITGDDAIDFIEEFAQRFNVDITKFDYDKYFGRESINIFEVISRLFGREKQMNHSDISLRKLLEAIRIQKLE